MPKLPKAAVPSFLKPTSRRVARISHWAGHHLNFFRVHVLVFTIVPVIAAAIFYASNEDVYVPFIDCLFVCVSAMTVTGLTTINVSTSTGWQQAILFILMCIGNISAVSVTMVWIRRHFFRAKFDHIIRNSAAARKKVRDIEEQEQRERKMNLLRLQKMIGLKGDLSDSEEGSENHSSGSSSGSADRHEMRRAPERKKPQAKGRKQRLRADMIRRMEGPAVLINSMGMPSTTVPETTRARAGSDSEGQSSAPGGILNAMDDPNSNPTPPSGQQPSIRISLPSGPILEPGPLTESPGNFEESLSLDDAPASTRSRVGSGPDRRPSILRLEARARQEESDANKARDPAGEPTEEIEGDSDDAGEPRTVQGFRTRFPESLAEPRGRARRVSDPPQPNSRRGSDTGLLPSGRNAANGLGPRHDPFPRAQTVEFAEPIGRRSENPDRGYSTGMYPHVGNGFAHPRSRGSGYEMERTMTGRSHNSAYSRPRGVPLARTQTSSKQRGFGGFPTPVEIAGIAIKRALPKVQEKLNRTMTMQRTSTIASVQSGRAGTWAESTNTKTAPYLSFDATVSGNSRFLELTEAQRDELGGVEYRAIDLLAKLIPAYWLLVNLSMVTIMASYINSSSAAKYQAVFRQQTHQPSYTWFAFFQGVSAYTNTGLSLIDTSMVNMQDAYALLIPMGLLILAGNTAFPIVLRLFIYVISKMVPTSSKIYETLRFLLDHPRRCFVYLFPSGQTWFLLFVLFVLNSTDWVAFLVLDIGNPVIERIPVGTRVFDGLFQSIAVRAAGFQVVSLLTLAPAVQMLYVIMMYLSAFPLALSVRSTNVYEERSLGIYEPSVEDDEANIPNQNNAKVWGNFLAAHARRQLAFDIWWLGFALWLVCIIEKNNIEDPTSNGWFTVFSCLFELTSAYGTVGLSTGTPTDNFSLSGRFHTLSKLVVICVMLRGRHRGLPVAIDRAVLLPSDLDAEDEAELSVFTGPDDYDRGTGFADGHTGSFGRNSGFSNIGRTTSGISFSGQKQGLDKSHAPPLQKHGDDHLSAVEAALYSNQGDANKLSVVGGTGGGMQLAAIKEVSATNTPPAGTPSATPDNESDKGLGAMVSGGSSQGSQKGKEREREEGVAQHTKWGSDRDEDGADVGQGSSEENSNPPYLLPVNDLAKGNNLSTSSEAEDPDRSSSLVASEKDASSLSEAHHLAPAPALRDR
ncbi:hypothetical protein IE53DRAFT_122868 [Violaceomyces palustris]|uniref:Uncharacterized protein n=1 Tax=Violaceomyces palustris TaxID=1673888 RepID=A0ACD0NVR4_9BASI|nr:hypothetical protein IE53DRAFT_122868 [Violaceomyces palustris]